MKCLKCGAELSEDTKFCSYCGAKVEAQTEIPPIPPEVEEADEPKTEEKYTYQNNTVYNAPVASKPASNADKIKTKFLSVWSKLSKFGKIAAIGITVFVILGLVAFLAGRIFAGILAVAQIAIVVVAILMKKQIIKVPKTWIPLVAIILSFVLIVPYFCLFKVNMADYEKYAWNEVVLANMLPKPESPYGEIISNTEDYLSLDVTKTSEAQYGKYLEACKNKGFTIDAETAGSFFYAYNDKGFKLSLSYYDSEMHIGLDAAMELGTLTWSDSEIAKLLPVPKSTIGNIQQDDEKGFAAYIGETTIEEYNSYVKACEDKGFTVDANKTEKSYSAKNADAYKLSVEYKGNNVIYISVDEPEFDVSIEIECVENLIFSKYDVEVYIDGELEGTIPHGDKETYSVVLTKGKHTISFESAEDDTLGGEVEVEISKNETLKFKISCSSSGIGVETISGTTTTEKPEEPSESPESTIITLTMGEDDFKGMDYKEAEKKFREMGFTKFEYKTVDTEDKSEADGTICYIEITEIFIGDSDFSKGDKFNSDSTITFYSYKYKEPEAPEPVFYSTNDYETAKKGNTGVFSYRERGGSYDIYWIIDFDEGYVYYFTDGNGESFCDKLKIESGDLNDKIIITYHDGGYVWSYGLHFKYINHPETLIMQDYDGFEYEYSTTDLDDALALRNTKTIKEY